MSGWATSPETDDYSVDELMAATLARRFRNDDQACNGMASFMPVCAIMLARMTHAPPGRSGDATNKRGDWLGEVVFDPRGGLFFCRAADFADDDDRLGLWIRLK